VTELFSTVYFGALTCGAREALEGEETLCSNFATLHLGSIEPLPGRGAPRGAGAGAGGAEALATSPSMNGRKDFGGIKKTGFGTGTSTDHNEMLPPPPYSMVAAKPPRAPALGGAAGLGGAAAPAMSTNDIARLMQAVQGNPALKQQLAAMQAMQQAAAAAAAQA